MDLVELKDLLRLLRKEGVTAFKTPELELTLSDSKPESSYKRSKTQDDAVHSIDEILAGAGGPPLTPEEALFYSSTPPPTGSDEDTDTTED
jgi:hypothetical protein